ncbi:hypothetical protein NM688_g8700 [Phlebia brevispora]|uniref:Uncharacterized protein n=1 Tax=Phlebia brevispora TaxID=194682 RepID=A0ACC1RSE1_9APHY|nr:hypothetical protein NM688_g8700 [Phlebia brevispora]
MKSKKWGTDVVVRIHLRNTQGREPPDEEVQDICQDARNAQRIVDSVTEEQIINAFQVGAEELGVYCMKCIEYDAAWQQYLVDNYGEWEVEYMARRAQKQQRRRNGPARKRRRAQDPEAERRRLEKLAGMGSDLSDLSDMDDDDSEEEEIEESYPPKTVQDIIVVDGEEMDEVQVLRSISRGTRSRLRQDYEPIVVD